MMNEMAINYGTIKDMCEECKADREAVYESIGIIKQQLNQVIENGFWVGADAIQFQARMNEKLTQLNNTANWISTVIYELEKYAIQMREKEQARAASISSNYEM